MAKPSVLICGGLNTWARGLALLLVPVDGEPLVSHLTVVDKYSVAPPTTYLGPAFSKILENPLVTYKQSNLTIPAIVTSVFDPPEGVSPYDYVFDMTGDKFADRTEEIQINTTCNIARLVATEAAKRKVKSYVRVTGPFYETHSKGLASEKDEIKPAGVCGTWWHETLRILSAIPDLNLVILRVGFVYGPFCPDLIATTIVVASVYGYIKKPMKALHGPGKQPYNLVHIEDIAGAAWAAAKWMEPLGRAKADDIAGEPIFFSNDKTKIKDVEGAPSPDAKLVAPVFNVVDDTNGSIASVGSTMCTYFGTTFEFFNTLENFAMKMSKDVVEDINEHHVGPWVEMLSKSNPPVPNTPLSAYMDSYSLDKRTLGYDNSKLKKVLGYELRKAKFDHEAVKEMVEAWKAEGAWPNL